MAFHAEYEATTRPHTAQVSSCQHHVGKFAFLLRMPWLRPFWQRLAARTAASCCCMRIALLHIVVFVGESGWGPDLLEISDMSPRIPIHRRRLLRAFGWKVVSIPGHEYHRELSDFDKVIAALISLESGSICISNFDQSICHS